MIEETSVQSNINANIDNANNQGLRVLSVGYKILSEEFWDEWIDKYFIEEKDSQRSILMQDLEIDLNLLGAFVVKEEIQKNLKDNIQFIL